MAALKVKLPKPHDGQRVVLASKARFRVLACGRRWGKTYLGVLLCIMYALGYRWDADVGRFVYQGRPGRAWWVAPSYQMAAVGWRLMSSMAGVLPNVEILKADRMILFHLPDGTGEIRVRSADDPQSLRGDSLDMAVFDEAAFGKEDAWTQALRPALADRKGDAFFISSPNGRNWFWRLFQLGLDPAFPDWEAWQMPTVSNPYIDPAEVEAAKLTLPEMIFRQEFLAEFVDSVSGVFRFVSEAATAAWQESARNDTQYVIGVDWGRHNDFTVVSVIDVGLSELCYVDRFNQIAYDIQVGRLRAIAQRFNPVAIVAERNSMGDPLVEQLQAMGLPIVPFQTTNASKTIAIQELSLAFEQQTLQILDDSTLIAELKAYEMERTKSGLIRYNAPSGMHDDMVMSLALAWSGVIGRSGLEPEQYVPIAQHVRVSTW